MARILFIASLHHPETLMRERQAAHQAKQPEPLFPSSTLLHFWERALRRRGHTLEIFYRNLSGFGSQDIAEVQALYYTDRLTPQRLAMAAMRRLPHRFNLDYRQRNANLLAHVRRFQPDVLMLVGDNTVIQTETLERIKHEIDARLVYISGVSPIVFSHPMERDAAPLYDLVMVNDYYHGIQWRELGAAAMVCLPNSAIDPDFHYPRRLSEDERTRLAHDVSFVGTLLPPRLYSERITALEALHDVDIGIWSVHDLPPSLQQHYHGKALGSEMLQILSAAHISLNVHGNFMRYGGNMRLFELAGISTFQIVDERPGVATWFNVGQHMVTFSDTEDLQQKVAYYLAHPDERDDIAAAARAHALQHHTYEQRLDALEAVFPLS